MPITANHIHELYYTLCNHFPHNYTVTMNSEVSELLQPLLCDETGSAVGIITRLEFMHLGGKAGGDIDFDIMYQGGNSDWVNGPHYGRLNAPLVIRTGPLHPDTGERLETLGTTPSLASGCSCPQCRINRGEIQEGDN